MPKKPKNKPDNPAQGHQNDEMEPEITETATSVAVLDPPAEDAGEIEADDFDADPELDAEPEPKPRRGRKPKAQSRADAGPMSLSDVVNSPEANEAWWQEHRLVIYRKDVSKDMKALMKADSGRTWIDRISGPFSQEEFDESYLRAHYGGGLFSVYLQEKPASGRLWTKLMEAEYAIAGPAKFTEEEAAAARRANPGQSPAGSPNGGSGDRSDLGAVLELLQRQIDRAEAPQAQALQSFAETIRTGQQASTEMLMASMRQVIELRSQSGNQSNDKLIEMLMGMLVKQVEARPAEAQKSGLDQLREMVALQKMVQELQPRREPGPFDEVAKALMLKAAETVVPEVANPAAAAAGGGSSWIKDFVAPLLPQLPALLTAGAQFVAQQHRARIDQLNHEYRLRSALIAQQRGHQPNGAPPPELAAPAVEQPQPSQEEAMAQQAQQQEAAKAAAQMELFVDALTAMYFSGEPPEDAAITLNTGFPQVVEVLRGQLASYGEWWTNGMVLAYLKQNYPGMRPVLNHPGFPAWIAPLWREITAPPQETDEEAKEIS